MSRKIFWYNHWESKNNFLIVNMTNQKISVCFIGWKIQNCWSNLINSKFRFLWKNLPVKKQKARPCWPRLWRLNARPHFSMCPRPRWPPNIGQAHHIFFHDSWIYKSSNFFHQIFLVLLFYKLEVFYWDQKCQI